MSHIMLDLETLGTRSDAAIIAIGAVAFDDGDILGSYYVPVDLASSVKAGLSIDSDTIKWWMQQEETARSVFNDRKAASLRTALTSFSDWYREMAGVEIWGNGSDFDNAILANAYKALGLDLPWKFYNNRCYRTVKNLFPGVKATQFGTKHNALDDARNQAEHLIAISKKNGNFLGDANDY